MQPHALVEFTPLRSAIRILLHAKGFSQPELSEITSSF